MDSRIFLVSLLCPAHSERGYMLPTSNIRWQVNGGTNVMHHEGKNMIGYEGESPRKEGGARTIILLQRKAPLGTSFTSGAVSSAPSSDRTRPPACVRASGRSYWEVPNEVLFRNCLQNKIGGRLLTHRCIKIVVRFLTT